MAPPKSRCSFSQQILLTSYDTQLQAGNNLCHTSPVSIANSCDQESAIGVPEIMGCRES